MEQVTVNKTQRSVVGVVTSVAGAKTIMVEVARRYAHPRYRKVVTRKTKYMAHDESSVCVLGDRVEIEECRPLSAKKRWRVVKTLTKAAG